jgi:hypothetical protein
MTMPRFSLRTLIVVMLLGGPALTGVRNVAITTRPETFLEGARRRAAKTPRTVGIPWLVPEDQP